MKKIYFLFLSFPFSILMLYVMGLLSVSPDIAFATPAIQASSSAYTASANSLTYAINVPAGLTNASIIVFYHDAGFSGSNASGITYNGTALTSIIDDAPYNPAGAWYLNSPDSGNNNVVVSVPNGPGVIWSYAVVVNGANISASPVSSSASCGVGVCTPTKVASALVENMFSTTLDELVLDNTFAACIPAPVIGFGTAQIEWGTPTNSPCSVNGETRSSKKTATSTGSTAMWETLTELGNWGSIAISLKSAAAVAGGGGILKGHRIYMIDDE